MKKRIILWSILTILAVIIAVILYKTYLEEDNTLSVVLEQELWEEVGPEPEGLANQETLVVEEVLEEPTLKEPILKEPAPNAPEQLPLANNPIPKQEVATAPTPSPKNSKKTNQPSKIPPSQMPLGRAALVETANNPWMIVKPRNSRENLEQWQIMLIRNGLRWDYTTLPQSSGMWKIIKTGNQLKVQLTSEIGNRKDILSRKQKGKYAVQILSVEARHFGRAIQTIGELARDGYYAYLYRTQEKFDKQYWYQVRIGFFKTSEEAYSIGQEVYFRYRDFKVLPKDYWVVSPSSRELSRELVDLKAQRNKPWIVELPLYRSQKAALADLPKLSAVSDFTYLAYKQIGNQIRYQTRLGFFETQAEAKRRINQMKKNVAPLAKAKVLKL